MKIRLNLVTLSTMLFSAMISLNYALLPSVAKEPIDTCADLQKIANRIAKEKGRSLTLHGFENLPIQTNVYQYATRPGTDRLCQNGYITAISPMGKKICRGHIYTNTESTELSWGIGYFRTTFYGPVNRESEFCRWL